MLQHLWVPRVQANSHSFHQYFRQCGDVTKTQVQPLSCHWMNTVSSIAHQRKPGVHDASAMVKAYRKTGTRRGQADFAKEAADAFLHFSDKCPFIDVQHGVRALFRSEEHTS